MYPSPRKCCIAMFCLLITMSACQPIQPLPTPLPTPAVLSFETIGAGQPLTIEGTWTDPEPGLLVIATPEDVVAAAKYISDAALLQLEAMDFTQDLALLVFYGWEPTLRYDFAVLDVVRKQTQISIIAEPGRISGEDAESSPYHAIKLRKRGVWGETFAFALYFDQPQAAVVTIEKYVP